MRAKNGTKKIVRGPHVGDPIAHSLVDGVFERAAAGIHSHNFRTEHAHARDVERLPKLTKNDLVILNLSGRGDKDMDTYSRLL